MSQLNIIPHGAVLIRNGMIDQTGDGRRIENLASSRMAREIDATGKIVMPAFVDPDISLTSPGPVTGGSPENCIGRMSQRRLKARSSLVADALATFGVLTVGANTRSVPDARNAMKALRTLRVLKADPLRIRSIFSLSPGGERTPGEFADSVTKPTANRMATVFRRELASLLEIDVSDESLQFAGAVTGAAATIGYTTRFRVPGTPSPPMLELAWLAGAVSLLCDLPDGSPASQRLADLGCVQVLSAMGILGGRSAPARAAIDHGMPFALASGSQSGDIAPMNPLLRLRLATRELGMSAEEGIVAVTYNAACALRFSHLTGSLEPGKAADICILNVDDYRELSRSDADQEPDLAMLAGKIIGRLP